MVCAAGGLPGELHKLWQAGAPGGYHMEYGFSCMGYEIAGGLGVKLAQPGARGRACMVGDGSYLMLNSELATAVMLGQKLTIVVLDNRGYGCINRLQRATGGASLQQPLDNAGHVATLPAIDFAAHAAAMGAEAEKVADIAELEPALSAPGPATELRDRHRHRPARRPPRPAAPGGTWPCPRVARRRGAGRARRPTSRRSSDRSSPDAGSPRRNPGERHGDRDQAFHQWPAGRRQERAQRTGLQPGDRRGDRPGAAGRRRGDGRGGCGRARGFPKWAATTPLRRARVLNRFLRLLEESEERIAAVITAEHGKVLSDAKGEVARGIEVVEFATGAPHLLKGEITENVGTRVDSHALRQPLAWSPGSRPSTSRPWCRCGCSRWRRRARTAGAEAHPSPHDHGKFRSPPASVPRGRASWKDFRTKTDEEVSVPKTIGIPLTPGMRLGMYVAWHNDTGKDLDSVFLKVTMLWTPKNQNPQPVNSLPIYMDVNLTVGGSNTFDVVPGKSSKSYEFTLPVGGRLLGVGGHLHDYGVRVRLEDAETGKEIAEVTATRDSAGHVSKVESKALRSDR